MRGDRAGAKKRDQHEPIQRVRDGECPVRRQEIPIEEHECRRRETEAERSPDMGARAEDHEQENECDVRFVEPRTNRQHARRHGHQEENPPGDRDDADAMRAARIRRVRARRRSGRHRTFSRRARLAPVDGRHRMHRVDLGRYARGARIKR